MRVLIVEDSVPTQVLIRKILEKQGYEVAVAVNGKEAFDQIQREDFDAVLMDCHMPVLDGFETTQKIRGLQDPKFKRLPIVALTSDTTLGDAKKCLESGMNAFLSKPVEPAQLAAVFHQYKISGKDRKGLKVA